MSQPRTIGVRSHAEKIADRCTHFTGVGTMKCEAGVVYESVRLAHPSISYRRRDSSAVYTKTSSLPCHASMNLGGATCALRCAPTPKEVAEQEAKTQGEITSVMEAMKRVREATNGERGVQGSVECPRCSRPLHFSVASSNGHTHAKCSTNGCLAWME